MQQKFTCFKNVVKNLVGGRLAWALASEERKLLAREETVLIPDEWMGFSWSPAILIILIYNV